MPGINEEHIRGAVIIALRRNQPVNKICELLDLKPRFVRRIRQYYEEQIASGVLPEDVTPKRKKHKRRSVHRALVVLPAAAGDAGENDENAPRLTLVDKVQAMRILLSP